MVWARIDHVERNVGSAASIAAELLAKVSSVELRELETKARQHDIKKPRDEGPRQQL